MEMNRVVFFPPPGSRTGSDFDESSSNSSSSSALSAWEHRNLLLVSRQPHRSMRTFGQDVSLLGETMNETKVLTWKFVHDKNAFTVFPDKPGSVAVAGFLR